MITVLLFFSMFVLLLMGHCIADFALQSDWISRSKNPFRPVDPATIPPGQKPQLVWPFVLTAHAGVHAAAVYVVMSKFFIVSPFLVLGLALFEWVAHWIIDYNKCANRYGIVMDQFLHVLCKLAYVVFLMFQFIGLFSLTI